MRLTPGFARARKTAVIAFLAFYLPTICIVSLPAISDSHVRLKTRLQSFLNPLQLWQSWWMFAAPAQEDFTLRARIRQASGNERVWSLPRPYGAKYTEAYLVGRYAKWLETALNAERYSKPLAEKIWQETCAHLAREVESLSNDPVVEIELIRIRTAIPKPELIHAGSPGKKFESLYRYLPHERFSG